MRLNKYLALYSGLSRRSADRAIEHGRVMVDGHQAKIGQEITGKNLVLLDSQKIIPKVQTQTIMLNKPVGYVCSRAGQGSKTIYDLLPSEFHNLNPVGRLDKDSSGLILLTNDGDLANRLTHPSYGKTKVYEVRLNKRLAPKDLEKINSGIVLSDGLSKLDVRVMSQPYDKLRAKESRVKKREAKTHDSYLVTPDSAYEVRMSEGKNRQIRRTFANLGYNVQTLNRIEFGPYKLTNLKSSSFQAKLDSREIPAASDSPEASKTFFSAIRVSSDTLPSEKRTFESPLDNSGGDEVSRKSSIM